MTAVFWLEQTESDVPSEDNWLSVAETVQLNRLRFPRRRADWRLGRWTAKCAVAMCLGARVDVQTFAGIEVRSSASGAPEVFIASLASPLAISLTHRAGTAACAVASSGTALGCDLELVEPHSDAFVADYFTDAEQDIVARAGEEGRDCLVSLLWSAKESGLKALRAGLRLETRYVSVSLDPLQDSMAGSMPASRRHCWNGLRVLAKNGTVFHGWWQRHGAYVRTLAAFPSPSIPMVSSCVSDDNGAG